MTTGDLRARMGGLCSASLTELRILQETGRIAGWYEGAWWGEFPWLSRVKELSDLALEAGAPEHYRRLRELVDQPWSRQRYQWRLTELIAAVAALGLRCQPPSPLPSPAGRGSEGEGTSAAPPPAAAPGRRLRGGREILEAIEGAYSYARWRAFKREALKFNAPVEWPVGRGQPLAFENPLKLWLAARAAAAEDAGARREGRSAVGPDPEGRQQAHTGGDDQPLGLVKRPKGRNAPGDAEN